MKKLTLLMIAAVLMCCSAIAIADEMKGGAMEMPKAGDEVKALSKVFGGNMTWTGECPAGSMGPDSPAMKTHGTAMCKSMLGGMWYMCDVQDMMGSGKNAMTWKGHMLVGYDMGAKAYRASCVDNMGTMTEFNGTLDGDKFVLETPGETMIMGQSMKDRLTWDWSDPGVVKFTDEHMPTGGQWMVFETGTSMMKSAAAHHGAKTTTTSSMKKP
jgi:hypothetical protein